jgi:tetratricopeptide (TPR) repeat protein
MSRKAKANPKRPPSPHDMDSAALAARAEAELALSRHKEAIELYKELLKREQRPLWVDGLAACYAGRAPSLAAKGMLKEALVLWRNRQQMCGKPLVEGPYLTWLMQAGEQGEAVRLLADPSLPDAARAELESESAINKAQGEGTALRVVAEATAAAVEAVAIALGKEGGLQAANLKVAELYIAALGNLAKTNNTMIVPTNLSDVASVVASAMTVLDKTRASTKPV